VNAFTGMGTTIVIHAHPWPQLDPYILVFGLFWFLYPFAAPRRAASPQLLRAEY